jgi:hypothetical protein
MKKENFSRFKITLDFSAASGIISNVKMIRKAVMEPITLTEREYVTLVAGYEPSDEEIRELITEYEDWLFAVENTGERDETQKSSR